MDVVRIGKFLSELRKEKKLTQEQLGEKIGVTNKTISRWENGNYLPPVEMLQILSEFYGISINEILSGERLSEGNFREKAEENLKTALSESIFTLPERKSYYKKKWKKEHSFELTVEMLVFVAAIILEIIFKSELIIPTLIIGYIWSIKRYNDMMAYIEKRAFGQDDKNPSDEKTSDEK